MGGKSGIEGWSPLPAIMGRKGPDLAARQTQRWGKQADAHNLRGLPMAVSRPYHQPGRATDRRRGQEVGRNEML